MRVETHVDYVQKRVVSISLYGRFWTWPDILDDEQTHPALATQSGQANLSAWFDVPVSAQMHGYDSVNSRR